MREYITVGLGLLLTAVCASAAEDADRDDEERALLAGEVEKIVEVFVTGRRLDEGVPTVPLGAIASRDVLGPEQVRETGARDINDLVQHIPALSSRPYNGGEAAAPSFSMRGLPDDGLTEYVQVLIDGVPASPLPYGWTAFSFLPITPDRIYAIDYIRGGHSVRYSPNTVGGILNLITHPIPRERMLSFRNTIGDFDYRSTMVMSGGTWGAYGVLATFVDRRGDGYRRNGAFDQQDVNVKFRWDVDATSWLATSASYMQSGHQAPGGLTQAQFDADRFANARPENRFDGNRTVVDVVYHRDLDESGWWEGFANVSKTKRHLRAQRPHFGTPATISDWKDDSWFYALGGRIEQQLEFGGTTHTIYGGARFHYEHIPAWELRSEPFPGGAGTLTQDAEFKLSTISFHIDDTFEPVERLTVVVGARIEWVPTAEGDDPIGGWTFDDEFFKVLPGVGASYELSNEWAVFANWFQGFRAPQVWGFAFATGTSSLDFEEGSSAEAGLRYRSARTGLAGSVTVWRTEYDNFGVFFTGSYENLGRIVANGVDLELTWHVGDVVEGLDGLSLHGSITLQDSELRSGPNRGNEVPYAWETKAAWRVRYGNRGWVASIGGTFVGESFSDDANTSVANAEGNLGINPSRTIWDARVARELRIGDKGRLELAVGATNLFDKDWFVRSRGGFFGGGVVAGPPLQAYASVDFTINW